MKFLFLRGQVPTDRDPRQIMYNKIENNCDMWTQLAYHISKGGYGEVWYWGGKRKVEYKGNFAEKWLPSFKKRKHDFNPDVIFCRGGFPEYDTVLRRNPDAFKIYYGAGYRGIPPIKQFQNYDLILVDTPRQLEDAKKKLPNKNIRMMIKPAADNIFKPYKSDMSGKVFDVILVGNYNKGVNKGHDFAFQKIGDKLKVLSVGNVPKKVRKKYPQVRFIGWVPRKMLPQYYFACKVAIICCGAEDSCPRVVPEALACNTPILVLDRVNIWKKKYITNQTGGFCSNDNFFDVLINMKHNYKVYSPYEYYQQNLSLDVAAKNIVDIIHEAK